ncbi:MAG: sulfatase [Deltaproteobacteria bacterium]|nr:sulfatase [Deltaproteobacteria bacterium]
MTPPREPLHTALVLGFGALLPAAWVGTADVLQHGAALGRLDAAIAVALWSGLALPFALGAAGVGAALGGRPRSWRIIAFLAGAGWILFALAAVSARWLTLAGALPLAVMGVALLAAGAAAARRLAAPLACALLGAPLLAALASHPAVTPESLESPELARVAEPRHVVLIVLDTLRADHLGAYGHPGKLTPTLDRLAAESRQFTECFAPASWTVPSHASLFTGLYPRSHGTHFAQHRWLDDRFDTLAEGMSRAGYRTLGLAANHHIGLANLAQGFDRYEPLGMPRGLRLRSVLQLLGGPARWIDEGAKDAPGQVESMLGNDSTSGVPTFLFINLLEPHWRYLPPAAERRRGLPEGMSALAATRQVASFFGPNALAAGQTDPQQAAAVRAFYAAEVRYQDEQLARILEVVDRRLERERTLLIVTSDHGENLGEAGRWDHVFAINDHLIRVPMLIRAPGAVAPGREAGLCQLLDVPATVADWTGAEEVAVGAGKSLLANPYPGRDVVFAEGDPFYGHLERMSLYTGFQRDVASFTARLLAARDDRFKLVVSSRTGDALYDVQEDPDEVRDVAANHPEQVTRLRAALARWQETQPPYREDGTATPGEGMTAEERQLLESLGYVTP